MSETQSMALYFDRLTLLGRLVGKVTHSVSNTLSGVIGLVEIASEETDQRECQTDLEESLKALRPASLMVRRIVELAAPMDGRKEAFGEIMGRFVELAGALRSPSRVTHDCSPSARSAMVAAGPMEHLLLAGLAMVCDRSFAGSRMHVECAVDQRLRVEMTASSLVSMRRADELDALQRPQWEALAAEAGATLDITASSTELRVRISWPVASAG